MEKVINMIVLITLVVSMCSGALYADEVVFEDEEIIEENVFEEEAAYEDASSWDEGESVTEDAVVFDEDYVSEDACLTEENDYIWEEQSEEEVSSELVSYEDVDLSGDNAVLSEDEIIIEEDITENPSYDNVVASGDCGESLTWKLTGEEGNMTLTISGSGEMEDYYFGYPCPWYDYGNSIVKVVFPEGVTNIGDEAFLYCSSLTSTTIPDGVTSIGERAFDGCNNLTSITMPKSVISIGNLAFNECRNLANISLPIGVMSIGDKAFNACSSLTSIVIPNSVTSIGYCAFLNCSNLTNVTIPNGVTSIGNEAFEGCKSLTSIIIPNSVTDIGYGTFSFCENLTSIVIPNSVTSIDQQAFACCSKLTSVTIPTSVTSIGFEAFGCCEGLTSITIPNSVTRIDDGAFASCSNLLAINVSKDNATYLSDDGVLFDAAGIMLICCPGGKTGEYIIPNNVTNIDNYAFAGCSSLTGINIPDSVTSIGEYAFYCCVSLTNITIPNSMTSIGHDAFANCESMVSITIPNSISSIPSALFEYCKSLTSIIIPKSVTSIGEYAFLGTALKDIYYGGNKTEWTNTKVGYHVLGELKNATIHFNYTGHSDTELKTEEGILREGNGWTVKWKITYDVDQSGKKSNAKLSIYLEGSNKEFGNIMLYSNYGNGSLMPWLLDEYGFKKEDFKSIDIQGGVDNLFEIISDQFAGYVNVKEVSLNYVSNIQARAFKDDKSLTTILGTENLINYVTVNDETFMNTGLTSFDFSNIKSIGKNAFKNTDLNEVTLGKNATQIGEGAFSECKNLTKIVIPDSVTSISGHAFDGCSNLKIYGYENSYAETYAKSNSILFVSMEKKSSKKIGWNICNTYQPFGYTEGYKFSLDTYISTFKETPTALLNTIIAQSPLGDWGGNCFGMSLLAGSSYMGTVDLHKYFSNSGDYLWEYGYNNIEEYEGKQIYTITGNEEAIRAIEKGSISQLSKEFLSTEIFKNDDNYYELIDFLKGQQGTQNCVLIGLEVRGGSHAVLFDNNKDIEVVEDYPGVYYIPIYDPNIPLGKENLTDPHPWYNEKESFILLDTNNGEYRYIDGGGNHSIKKAHKNMNHRNIQFFDLTKLPKDFYNNQLTMKFFRNDNILGIASRNLSVEIDGKEVIRIDNNDVTQLDDDWDYHVFYNNDPNGYVQRFIEIPSNSIVSLSGNDVKAVLSNEIGAISIDSTSNIEVHSDINNNQIEATSNQPGKVTISYSFLDDQGTTNTEVCEANLNKGESFACTIDNSVEFTSKENIAANIKKYVDGNVLDEQDVILSEKKFDDRSAQPMTVSTTIGYAQRTKLSTESQTIKNTITVFDAQGKITFSKVYGSDNLSISEDGIITVEKGTISGTYDITVKVTAAGNELYEPGSETVTVTVTIVDDRSAQPMTVSTKTGYAKRTKLQSKKQTIKNTIKISNAQGKVSFSKVSGSDKLTINKSGTITVKKGTKSGTYTIKVKVKAAGNNLYKAGAKKVTVKVVVKDDRKKQPMTVAVKNLTVKASVVKKNKKIFTKAAVFTVKKAQGSVTFKKVSGSKNLTISKAGKITVKKGTKKGTYTVKVKVKAGGNDQYRAGAKTVTVKIVVK